MKKQKILDIIHGAVFALIFGGALLADGLGKTWGGFIILAAIVAAAGALVFARNCLERELARQERRRRNDR